MRASSELQFGALREGGGTREARSTVAESLVALYRVGTHQIRRRRRAARSSTGQGKDEPLCASIKGANREVFTGKRVGSTRATRSNERARFVGLFQGCTGLWTAGCWLARRPHQRKASVTMVRGTSIFPVFVRCVASRNLNLLIEAGWSVICPVCC